MCITVALFGCDFLKNDDIDPSDLNGTGSEGIAEVYRFMEECSNGEKYLKVESFEVATSYENIRYKDSYYIILGVDTNLTESDFTNPNNQISLWLKSEHHRLKPKFKLWDCDNEKLVYEVRQEETIDYSQLLELKVLDYDEINSSYLSLNYDALDPEGTIIVDNQIIYSRLIVLDLE